MMNTVFIFISVIFSTVFNLFFIGIKGNEINRAVNNIPVALLNNSILVDFDDGNGIYFDKITLEEDVVTYYNYVLKGKIPSYKISFYYYKIDEDGYSLETSEFPKNVQVHFYAVYYKTYEINKYLTFEIEEIWGV